jgi:glucose/mannose-6-phosphate isomerase
VPDSQGFADALIGLPDQVEAAFRRLTVTGPHPDHDSIANVLVTGTGAAGWVGDLLAAVAGPFMPVPLLVQKGFSPPSFVDSSTLVVAISASGNAPETVSVASACVEAGAQLFAVTSGGQLGALADSTESPTVFLPIADGPTHVPPRARIGALTIPVLTAFDRLGFYPGGREWIAAAIAQLRDRRSELDSLDNLMAHLAGELAGTMPLVYGGSGVGRAAAMRWKDQINQNAKSPAWWGVLPDVVHGELAGWGQHGDITRQVMSLVLLRHDEEPPEVAEQFALIEEWMEEVMVGIHTVQAGGEGSLAQLLDLAYVGDMVSLALADRYGIDPGPTPVITPSPTVAEGSDDGSAAGAEA